MRHSVCSVTALMSLLAIAAPVRSESQFWEEMATPGITEYRAAVSTARGLIAAGDAQRALVELEGARQRLPDRPEAHCWTALALGRLERFEEAARAWDHALEIDPGLLGDESLSFECTICFARIGRYSDATDIYRRMIARGVSPQLNGVVLVNMAEMLVAASCDGLDAAIELYQEAVRNDPDRAGAHWGLGAALVRAGRAEEAAAELAVAQRLDPQWTSFSRPGTFFVPPYDRYFYQALGWEQVGNRERAASEWETYLRSGGAEGCWADTARAHLEALRRPVPGRRR
jgi:pentatricopeptide repeat protein